MTSFHQLKYLSKEGDRNGLHHKRFQKSYTHKTKMTITVIIFNCSMPVLALGGLTVNIPGRGHNIYLQIRSVRLSAQLPFGLPSWFQHIFHFRIPYFSRLTFLVFSVDSSDHI